MTLGAVARRANSVFFPFCVPSLVALGLILHAGYRGQSESRAACLGHASTWVGPTAGVNVREAGIDGSGTAVHGTKLFRWIAIFFTVCMEWTQISNILLVLQAALKIMLIFRGA
ncbi:hypothetical protein BS78_03G165300 [Paspalum vaginatum]|nr:hypothetical protein BS78_03G165300 [Paspalum vaginatum]